MWKNGMFHIKLLGAPKPKISNKTSQNGVCKLFDTLGQQTCPKDCWQNYFYQIWRTSVNNWNMYCSDRPIHIVTSLKNNPNVFWGQDWCPFHGPGSGRSFEYQNSPMDIHVIKELVWVNFWIEYKRKKHKKPIRQKKHQ